MQAEGHASTDQTQWQLRGYINKHQRDAECHRAKSWQELSAKNKWLHWEEVIEVVRCQREEYESETRPDLRAVLSQDYAQLLLYTSLPPGRAEEYRTLRLKVYTGSETVCPATTSTERTNVLHMSENGSQALMEIGKHKTVSSAGRQLIDLRSTDYLVAHLLDYVHKDRPLLLQGREDHGYLFMVSHSQHSSECTRLKNSVVSSGVASFGFQHRTRAENHTLPLGGPSTFKTCSKLTVAEELVLHT